MLTRYNTEVYWFIALFTRCKSRSVQPENILIHHAPRPFRANCPWTVGDTGAPKGYSELTQGKAKIFNSGKKMSGKIGWCLFLLKVRERSPGAKLAFLTDHGLGLSYQTLIPSIKIMLFKQFMTIFCLLFKLSCCKDWTTLKKGLGW